MKRPNLKAIRDQCDKANDKKFDQGLNAVCAHIYLPQILNYADKLEAAVRNGKEVISELVDILGTSEGRDVVDSFTSQPAEKWLDEYSELLDE